MGHSAVHEYLQTLRRWYKVKRQEAPPSQPTCSSGALRSVGCFGCANSRLSSVIAQKQMCAKYRTLPDFCCGRIQYPETDAGIRPVFVPIFQACLDSMGLPIESRRFKKVWKRKSARRKEPFLKRFFLLAFPSLLSSPLLPSSHSPFFSPRSSISPVMSGRGGGACRKIGTPGYTALSVRSGSFAGWSGDTV